MSSALDNLNSFIRDGLAAAAQDQTVVMQSREPGRDAPSESEQRPGGINPLLLFAMLAFAFWFIILRPGRREKQDRQKKLNAIKKGDRVVSIGGIHGKITDVDHTTGVVTVEVAPKVPIKFSKAAIQSVEPRGTEKPETKSGE